VLPTFVIGLREGVEASLIVGIVATFLVGQGRRDALKWIWLGVAGALALCAGVAVALRIAEDNLPQKQQEELETVVGLLAVGMVTWMILWMRKNARSIKSDLESKAALAIAGGSVATLVVMAFLAVLREGFETAVFLLAAFQSASNPGAAGTGAVLGVLVAVGIGYGIYRGGVHLDLAKFFTATAVVLVLIAAGLMATAAHTAHEAGWLNAGQAQVLDLSWLVRPGTVLSALLTGMLGIQPQPVVAEVVVWLLYAVPMLTLVLWPRHARHTRTTLTFIAAALAAAVGFAACGSDGGSGTKAADGKVETAGSSGTARTVTINLVKEGCSPAALKLAAGPTNFVITNEDADAISEMEIVKGSDIVGEAELVAPGLTKRFSVTLKPGRYVLTCPGGTKNDGKGTLVVTGKAVDAASTGDAAAVATAVATYRGYLQSQADDLVTRTRVFVTAVKAGDVEAAKAAYVPARLPYERIEPVVDSFGDLDSDIDARDGDVPSAGWGGFHKIEQALWVGNTTVGMGPVADKLLADTGRLQSLVRTVKLEPATIANGAVELLNEVSSSKITGEEERYSKVDLADLAANVEGSRSAFESVAPLLPKSSPVSAATIFARFDAVQSALVPYQQGESYVLYTALTADRTRALAQVVDAVAEPLSQVAEQVVT
jgi:high-affinity iron transporter